MSDEKSRFEVGQAGRVAGNRALSCSVDDSIWRMTS
jgi:hypothetical protein